MVDKLTEALITMGGSLKDEIRKTQLEAMKTVIIE